MASNTILIILLLLYAGGWIDQDVETDTVTPKWQVINRARRDFIRVRKTPGRRLLYIIIIYRQVPTSYTYIVIRSYNIRPILLLTRYDFGYLSFYLNNAITITTRIIKHI